MHKIVLMTLLAAGCVNHAQHRVVCRQIPCENRGVAFDLGICRTPVTTYVATDDGRVFDCEAAGCAQTAAHVCSILIPGDR